jgi:hypothetical protein
MSKENTIYLFAAKSSRDREETVFLDGYVDGERERICMRICACGKTTTICI